MVRMYALPNDPAAWPGIKGRVVRSTSKFDSCVSASGALLKLLSGKDGGLVACTSHSGAVSIRPTNMVTNEDTTLHQLHDVFEGGCSAMAISMSGTTVVTGGRDGSVIVSTVTGSSAFVPMIPAPVPATTIVDRDTFDEPSEVLYWIQRDAEAKGSGGPESPTTSSEELACRVTVLKQVSLHTFLVFSHRCINPAHVILNTKTGIVVMHLSFCADIKSVC